jgi:hypothetical protein
MQEKRKEERRSRLSHAGICTKTKSQSNPHSIDTHALCEPKTQQTCKQASEEERKEEIKKESSPPAPVLKPKRSQKPPESDLNPS